jgi:hypothetical protein
MAAFLGFGKTWIESKPRRAHKRRHRLITFPITSFLDIKMAKNLLLGAAAWLTMAANAHAAALFSNDSYSVSLAGVSTFNGVDNTQGLVFDYFQGSPGGTFTTANPGTGGNSPTGSSYLTQVDAPFASQVYNSNTGTSLLFYIDNNGLISISAAGNLSNMLPVAVSADIIVSGLNFLNPSQTIGSVDLVSDTLPSNAFHPTVLSTSANGFTIRLSDGFGFDGGPGEAILRINAVPEPGTLALMMAAGGLLGLRRRA